MKAEAKDEIAQILEEFAVKDVDSLYALPGVHVALLYESLKPIQEKHGLSPEDMEALLEAVLR